MESNIIVSPERVWSYFNEHKHELKTDMILIAESGNGLLGIYITEENGYLQFIVEDCDERIDENIAINASDCESTARGLYFEYLDCDYVLENGEDEEVTIDEREDELSVIFENLIIDILGNNYLEDNIETVSDIKEHTLEYMARKHGIPIYRPMFLEDEDGCKFYSEYPYEEMIFDDNNPIYGNN